MINNAIAWTQFQLRGGLRNAIVFVGSYAALVIVGYAFARGIDPRGFGRVSFWTGLLMGIQSLALVVFAGSRIGVAVRRDLTSGMIESHRLMPTPPWQAILGYMFGGAGQGLILAAVNFVLGGIICAMSGAATDQWILGNGVLLLFAIFIWTLVTLGAFVRTKGRGGIGWVIAIVMISFTSQGMITVLIPPLIVLASPLLGSSVFVASGGVAAPSAVYAMSLLAQIAIGSLYFVAATRRYRSAEASGFTPWMAIALLAAWVLLTIYSIRRWEVLQPAMVRRAMQGENNIRTVQVIAGTIIAMLMSLLPLSASVRFRREWERHRAANDPALGPRPIAPAIAELICATLCLAVVGFTRLPPSPQGRDFLLHQVGISDRAAAMSLAGALLLSFTFACAYIFQIGRRARMKRIGGVITAFIVLLFIVPLLVEVLRNVTKPYFRLSRLSGVSPLGAMINLFGEGGADAAPGVIVQMLIALVLALMYHLGGRKRAAALA